MPDTGIEARNIARAAAEGVAIALAAREPAYRGPIHIICGIPQEIFEVTLEASGAEGLKVSAIAQAPESGR